MTEAFVAMLGALVSIVVVAVWYRYIDPGD